MRATAWMRRWSTPFTRVIIGAWWCACAARDITWFAKLAPGALPRGVAPGQDLPLAFDREHAWLFAA